MTTTVVPDLVRQIRRFGTFDANACLSCGSCTVVCNLSNGLGSFPRKPIRRALLGLKGAVLAGLEPWLCHDCGDCSASCPRQAEPQESMMTLRRYLVAQYDFTGIASKVLGTRVGEVVALFLVGLLVFGLALWYHLYYVELDLDFLVTTAMGMEHMFPLVEYFTYAVFAIPVLIILVNIARMHHFTMGKHLRFPVPLRYYVTEAKTLFIHMVSHKHMKRCDEDGAVHNKRWIKHWLLALAVTAKCAIILFFLRWFQTDGIYPIYDPQRWVGYLIAAAMIVVPADILISRWRHRAQMHKFSEPSDVILPVMLILIALSGLVVHGGRYLGFELTGHIAYAVHLAVAVPLIMIELPFGKWSHALYRPFAIYFATVKERALKDMKVPTVVGPAKETVPLETTSV
jgi:quinone-modifying oxidoreductase subunit QmoC